MRVWTFYVIGRGGVVVGVVVYVVVLGAYKVIVLFNLGGNAY